MLFRSLSSIATVSASISCLQARSQCRSIAQNHRAVKGSVKNAIVIKQKNHARCHMTQTSIPHHLVNTTLTKCRLKRKIETHPIPLSICVLLIGLGYLTRIAAKAHGHWNTTRQRQRVEGISGHPVITTIEPNLF